MPRSNRPTDAELDILAVLWQEGPCTVRQIHEKLSDGRGYTTILKLVQLMHEKGIVTRDASSRSHVYSAAAPVEKTRMSLVQDLAKRAFEGSSKSVALYALGADFNPEELKEIERLVEKLEAEH